MERGPEGSLTVAAVMREPWERAVAEAAPEREECPAQAVAAAAPEREAGEEPWEWAVAAAAPRPEAPPARAARSTRLWISRPLTPVRRT